MSNRPAFMTQADANRLFKAARSAGYDRTRIVSYPDGRREVIAETVGDATKRSDAESDWDDLRR